MMNVPKLRFKGFSEEWQNDILGHYILVDSGIALKGEEITENATGIPILRGINITEGYIRHREEIDRYYLGDNKKIAKYLLNEGDIVLGMDGSKVGKNVAIITSSDANSILIQRVARIKQKGNLNSEYLYHQIFNSKFHKYVDRVNTSSGIPHISLQQIRDFPIPIPPYFEEQEKIASFFTAVDSRLEKLKKKKEFLEQYKKGVMQKIFSQDLRFKDEKGNNFPDWEEKKLGALCTTFSGGTPKSTNKDYYKGNIPFIKSGEISNSNTEQFISEEALNNSSAKLVDKGDLLYALYGATSGNLAICKISGAINQAILCIRSEKINIKFLSFFLQMSKQGIISNYLQGGQGNLSAEIIKNLTTPNPSIQEQQKIADFLTALDKKIDLVNLQISKTELWKKGLLQQMFV